MIKERATIVIRAVETAEDITRFAPVTLI